MDAREQARVLAESSRLRAQSVRLIGDSQAIIQAAAKALAGHKRRLIAYVARIRWFPLDTAETQTVKCEFVLREDGREELRLGEEDSVGVGTSLEIDGRWWTVVSEEKATMPAADCRFILTPSGLDRQDKGPSV